MGLFGGGFEKTEAKADAALVKGEALQAYRLFGDALRQAGSKAADAPERLREKQTRARLAFVRLKLDEALGFVQDEVAEAALESLAIAREYVVEGDQVLRDEIAALSGRASALGGRVAPATAEPAPEPDPEPVDEETAPEMPSPEDEFLDLDDAEGDPEILFEQLAGILSPADLDHAETLGRAFKIGFVATQRGDAAGAASALEEAAREHPDDALVLEYLALACDHADRPLEAAEHYRRALALDPARWNARIALASVMAGASTAGGQIEAAIELLDEGGRVDPDRGSTYLLAVAETLLTARRPLEAIARIEQAMQSGAAEAAQAWQFYGGALEEVGRLDDAEEALMRAVRLGGQSMQPRAQFAEFALRTGRALEDAGEMIFDICINCQATMPSIDELDYYGFLLTRIQYARGQYRQAIEGADRLLAKGPAPAVRQVLLEVRRQAKEALTARKAPAPEEEAP
jgi:tetratricopeptide (TPR) repeat protein